MSTAQAIAQEQLNRVLEDAIQKKRRGVLSHHSSRGWRTFSSHFVSGSHASKTILVNTPIPPDILESAMPQSGNTLGFTFRTGHKKCLFAATVESIGRQGRQGRITLRWPDQIKQLQRRLYERVPLPTSTIVAVRLWRETEADQTPLEARTVCHGQLVDLSVGGMRVKVAHPDMFEPSTVYRCVFTPKPGKPPIMAHGMVRHHEAVDHGRACIGFQFVGLEATPEGGRVLDRLARTVTQLQRIRHRNHR